MISPSFISPNIKITDTITIDITGMKCAGCVKAVERQIIQQQGIVSANVNLITAVALVQYESSIVQPETLAQKLTAIGFPSQVRVIDEDFENPQEKIREKRRLEQKTQQYQLISAILLLIFSSIGHLHHLGFHSLHWLSNIWFHWGLATASLLIPGREILLNGWQGLWQKKPNMNSLVGLGTTFAYVASCVALLYPSLGWECFFDEPVMLLGFIFLGRVLESRARNRAIESLEDLLSLRPQFARLVGKINSNQDQGLEIPAIQVKPEEWVRVLSGEQFPVDGIIMEGETTVDESLLTGESLPVFKRQGDKVYAGTINNGDMVILEAVNTGKNTALSQIIATVENAQTRKAPVQKMADTVSGYFTYTIISIALLVFSFWYFWGTQIWSHLLLELDTSRTILSLKLAIDVLVIACPCALGLATPTAILVGTTTGAENGLLIKGGDVLEQVKNLSSIVFDKTGTLTQGYPQLENVVTFSQHSDKEILQIASSLEISANHPLAKAILNHANKLSLDVLPMESFANQAGKGVKGKLADDWFYLGNRSWLQNNSIELDSTIILQCEQWTKEGKTVVYLGKNSDLIGLITLSDQIRPDAKSTVKTLQNMGLDVIMMSGDQPLTTQYIAEKLGIDTYYGGLTPSQKSDLIAELQKNSKNIVAMVGDGINDTPAMTTAQFSIALNQGSEIAIKTAGIVLTTGKLKDVVTAINLSKLTLRKIQQNLFWALSYNLMAIPLASGFFLPKYQILLNPATAGALMALSSIIVVTNSLLLKNSARKFLN
ncbi:heavy metal translocating P-type ATPase [Geminocystis sp. CENA526]|uniref:heavy metal translocating P-type ATPase n=1 Tax=Geminocystis sp. CENA526 TaxID=1355871 RepID=UPI003D6EA73B